ncbi:hypothetical protein BsWGS_03153 [Bradybaena similaris]
MESKPWKRGVLERAPALSAPVLDTVTETRSRTHGHGHKVTETRSRTHGHGHAARDTRAETFRPDPSFRAWSPPLASEFPDLPPDLAAEQVVEDYTEAYFNEHCEDEQLVSSKKPEYGSSKDTDSDVFQSHVNPAFQYDTEPISGNKSSISEKVAELPKAGKAAKTSRKIQENLSDAGTRIHSKLKQNRERSHIPKASKKDQVKALDEQNTGSATPKVEQSVARTEAYNRPQDEVNSGHTHAVDQDVQITVTCDAYEIIEVHVDDSEQTDRPLAAPVSSENSVVLSPTGQEEYLEVVAATQQKRSGGGRGRSFSSMIGFGSNRDRQPAESRLKDVQRSQSMRLPPGSDSEKPRAKKPLLRDLSFSDCDSRKFQNYGSLRTSLGLPKRRQVSHGDAGGDQTHIPKFLKEELASHLLPLMQQLLGRGKVQQVAVLEQRNGCMVTSLPTWHLTHRDQIGLVKAASVTLETMLKISVDNEHYTCFKHGADKIVCHSGDSVLVAQTTISCVVVGRASDNTPGSCLYEVSELVRALLEKGW